MGSIDKALPHAGFYPDSQTYIWRCKDRNYFLKFQIFWKKIRHSHVICKLFALFFLYFQFISYFCKCIVAKAAVYWHRGSKKILYLIRKWFVSSKVPTNDNRQILIESQTERVRLYRRIRLCVFQWVGNCGRDAWTSEYERRVRFLYGLRPTL